MSSILDTAMQFFQDCESGKGWAVCQSYCHPDATFSSQTVSLAEITSLEGYTEWMKALFSPMPDARYELRHLALDDDRHSVAAYAVFRGTHTGPDGPVAATGNTVVADYVYVMQFDGDRIRHMVKIWNDIISLQQLGWAP
ncbi:MAG: ester cyclase [Pseudomonadota bacterium]|nr:ester cyclase [Pseudomonadota bacterium]